MAIKKRYKSMYYPRYVLVCDFCGDEAGNFDSFDDAVCEKKSYGFRSVRIDGKWADLCENCQNLMKYKQGTATAAEDFAGIV